MIKEVKLSCSKHEADRKARKALIEAQEPERYKKKEDLPKQVETTKAKELLDAEIVTCKSSLKVADDIIEDAKDNLHKALSKRNIDRELTSKLYQILRLALKERKFENYVYIVGEKYLKNAGMKTFFISLSLVFIFLISSFIY